MMDLLTFWVPTIGGYDMWEIVKLHEPKNDDSCNEPSHVMHDEMVVMSLQYATISQLTFRTCISFWFRDVKIENM